jgi:hypothetical protein
MMSDRVKQIEVICAICLILSICFFIATLAFASYNFLMVNDSMKAVSNFYEASSRGVAEIEIKMQRLEWQVDMMKSGIKQNAILLVGLSRDYENLVYSLTERFEGNASDFEALLDELYCLEDVLVSLEANTQYVQ